MIKGTNNLKLSQDLALEICDLINNQMPDELPNAEQMANIIAALSIAKISYIRTFREYGYNFVEPSEITFDAFKEH